MKRQSASGSSSRMALFFAKNRVFDKYQAICARVTGTARTVIKQFLMLLYNHQLINGSTVLRLFDRFELWNA